MTTYLTKEEIILAHIESGGSPCRLIYYNDPSWWSQLKNYNLPKPIKLKFDDEMRKKMPSNLKKGKGIYMFFLETTHPFPKDIHMRHILYVGRVIKTNTFHKRMYYYIKNIGDKKAARNRMRLTNLWPDHTYIYFFDLTSRKDSDIEDIEKNIFNNIVPPLNEELHGDARKTRQFY